MTPLAIAFLHCSARDCAGAIVRKRTFAVKNRQGAWSLRIDARVRFDSGSELDHCDAYLVIAMTVAAHCWSVRTVESKQHHVSNEAHEDRTLSAWKVLLAIVAALALPALGHAKGNFQAEGRITGLEAHEDEITFRFAGTISFRYLSAPENGESRLMTFEARDLPVHIANWTEPYKPSVRARQSATRQVCAKILDLMKSDQPLALSVDNPSLVFSNTGELVRVNGTFFYAHQIEKRASSEDNKTAVDKKK